jgi:hypothetical protein
MEKEGQEIAASDGGKGPAEQHAIDVGHVVQHGDGKGEDDIEKERVAVVEDVQTKKKSSRRVAALDAFRGLTIVVRTHIYIHSTQIYFSFVFIYSEKSSILFPGIYMHY